MIRFQVQNKLPEVKISIWPCDISDADSVELVVKSIPAEHEGIIPQKLVHTAGFCQNFNAHEYDAASAQKLVNVDLLGSLYICQSMTRLLLAKRTRRKSISQAVNESGEMLPQFPEASFVLIGSMSGLVVNTPQPQCAYNMAKAGVIHLVKSLALSLIHI